MIVMTGLNVQQDVAICCPVCREQVAFSPLRTYQIEEAAEHFCPASRDAALNRRMYQKIQELWGQDESYFLRCEHCSYGFGYPFAGGDEEFYDLMHASAGYPSWRWDYGFAMKRISESRPSASAKVLDFGAGHGLFIRKLDDRYETYATEGGEETRKVLREAGVKVLYGEELSGDTYRDFFDYITLFQVLEHLSDFRPILVTFHQALKPGGEVMITVPLQEAMIDQEKFTGCLDMPPNHINKWTPDSLKIVLEQVGFKVVKMERESSSFRFSNLKGILQMTIAAAARKGRFPARQVYGIKNRQVRIMGMALLSVWYFFAVLPHLPALLKGRCFAIVGQKN